MCPRTPCWPPDEVRLTAPSGVVLLLPALPLPGQTVPMRPVCMVLAIIGGCALAVTVTIEVATGNLAGAGWALVGPAPFYAVGLIGTLRGPAPRVATWLLATGSMFMLDTCLLDAVAHQRAVAGTSYAWVAVLIGQCASNAAVIAAIGLIGLFPTGVPQSRSERLVLEAAAVTAALLPLLLVISSRTPPAALFEPADPTIASPLFLTAARPVEPVAAALQYTFAAWETLGLIMLYLRYRRSQPDDRRRIRWFLLGTGSGVIVFAVLVALASSPAPGPFRLAFLLLQWALWALVVALVLGSLVVPLSQDGVFGIDQSAQRSMAFRALWLLIAVVYVAASTTLGLIASRYLPVGAAVLMAASAAVLFQPVRRRLERLADRWVFGDRLDGYDLIARFGSMLETSPGPDDLLPRLAAAIREGLGLQWARVRLDLAVAGGDLPTVGTAGIEPGRGPEPELVVPLIHAGSVLGRIECGRRRDGALLDEDRRLLANLAGQAATAVRNLHLTAELSDRLDTIGRQTAELTASRARLAQARDAERQRIQRDLHDGVQQDLVVLTAKLALARERLRRGDPRADEPLAELHQDLADLLVHLREFAHAIHPPVLADQGLLAAIEAQAARLPLEVVIESDPALRGVRYPQHIETATWFVVAEALTNAVKHSQASWVLVALTQPDTRLAVEVRDDGCGFDPATVHGLGLAGLADRISIVNGTLRVDSGPGRGTTLRAEIPLTAAGVSDG
jgi:signal transduction histidine kinase